MSGGLFWTQFWDSRMIADVRLFKSAEEKQEIAEAEVAYRDFVSAIGRSDPNGARELVARLEGSGKLAVLSPKERRRLGDQAFLEYASNALADDHLTEDEEDALGAVADAVGFTPDDLARHSINAQLEIA
jgi:hypothetical protein